MKRTIIILILTVLMACESEDPIDTQNQDLRNTFVINEKTFSTNFAYYSVEDGGDYQITLVSQELVLNTDNDILDKYVVRDLTKTVNAASFSDITPFNNGSIVGDIFYDETEMLPGGADYMSVSSINFTSGTDLDGYLNAELVGETAGKILLDGELMISKFDNSLIELSYRLTYESNIIVTGTYMGNISKLE